MDRLCAENKKEVWARIEAFPKSGLPANLSPRSICNHYKSLLGRDYKLLAQTCLFIFWEYFTASEREIWKKLTKVSASY